MGSSYFGGTNPGNERSSSRKGKKSNSNAEYNNKPKQPQRGLGVAQLEQIRLHAQLASAYPTPTLTQEDERMQTGYPMYTSSSSSSYGFHVPQNIMGGLAQLEGTTTRYGDSQPSTTPRWKPTSYGILDTQQSAQPSIARHFLNPQAEDLVQKRRNKGWSDSIDASSQNSQTIDDQELDLELRL
ncbi:protein SPEAR3-like [Rhododendron vialii]|uniref:protein SPEAR3-like n=1 Tax=Rhododendron vialii TaxID=182163 RepID=UPI00265E9B93|nr:protein SPEAR3-like [Rhododendron vialii]